MKEKLKGVEGWLFLLVIIFVFITPLYLIYDVIINPSFYSFSSGVYDLASLVWVFVVAIWSIMVGIGLWTEKKKAVIWAKEFLIVTFVLGIFFIIFGFYLYTYEEQSILFGDLFSAVISFVIWFSYLSISKRVKNTFKDRKLSLKRLGIIFLVVLGTLFSIFIISSLIPQNIETAGVKISGGTTEFEEQYTLESESVGYHEFEYQNIASDLIIEFNSNYPVDVLIVKSEQDYNNYASNLDYEGYKGCSVEGQYSGEIRCVVSTGGVIVWNYNLNEATYTLKIK